MNRCKKKVIPWHVHQRYMESLSQLSLNQTISTALYKKKIRSLQRNNKHLALALQRNRGLATEKENLLIDNGKILDIINFSRVKLMNMAINMKQATECLDETLLLLNSSLNDSLSKHSPLNLNYRNSFKSKLQEISRNSSIEEVSENSSSSNKNVASCAQKGKISRVDGCVSSPSKKRKVTMKERTIKINFKDHEKSTKEFSSAVPTTCSKNTNLKTSKKCNSTLNIKSPNRKKSITKNSKNESASSKLPKSSSNLFLQAKTNEKSQDNKQKAVKVMLTDIAEEFLTQGTKNHHSPIRNGCASSSSDKRLMQNSPEDDILIKKYFSSDFTCKQKSSASNSCDSKFASMLNADYSQNTSSLSNFSHENLFFDDITEIDKKPTLLSLKKNEDFVLGQASTVVKMDQIEESDTIAKQNKGSFIKKIDSEKDKKPHKSHNSKVANRVHFYFDEDAIEKVEGNTITSKDRMRKSFNKCKARKTVSHRKKNIPSESAALKSNLILSDSVSKLGKNSFLVTAEVHSPPNGINTQKFNKICDSEKMDPCVVLTDVFKSNRSLLSEMVGGGLQEKGCLQRSTTKSAIAPLAEMNSSYTVNENHACNGNDVNTAFIDAENDTAGEDYLLEDRSVRKKVFCQDRSKESKNICTKQPTVVLRDIINCKKAFNKYCEAHSKKDRKNFISYLLHDKENRCLPEDIEIIERGKQRRRSKIVSYKEPSLNVKMRRLY